MNNNTNVDNTTDVAAQKEVETVTTQTESPQVEKPITGAETTQKEEVSKTPSVDSTELPTDNEEQRRSFQEMRLENKRLKEEVESRGASESAFDVLRPQTPPVSQTAPVDIRNFFDTTTGQTDWQAYNHAVQNKEQAILATARAEAQSTVQETLDEDRARNKYPDLFKDKTTEKQIASRWFYEKIQGNNVSISDIADEFARNYKQAVSKAEKIGADRAINEVQEKEQAGLAASSQTSSSNVNVIAAEQLNNLQQRTRKGDGSAIAERLSQIPWANK